MTRWLPVPVDYEAWLTRIFLLAAGRLAVEPLGKPTVFSRNVAGRVVFHTRPAWLRVAPFLENGMDEEAWTGTREAGAILGVGKPALLGHEEWTETDPVPVRVAADLMTLAPGQVAMPGDQFLDRPVELSPAWLADLRESLDALARHETKREFWAYSAERHWHLLNAVYGRPLPDGVEPTWGSTQHLDLHWGNVTIPDLMIVDWEHWGTGVAGYGAARLYCTALAVPEVADQIHETFADILDSPSGRYAQLVAAADIIVNVAWYEDAVGLCPRLHDLAGRLLASG